MLQIQIIMAFPFEWKYGTAFLSPICKGWTYVCKWKCLCNTYSTPSSPIFDTPCTCKPLSPQQQHTIQQLLTVFRDWQCGGSIFSKEIAAGYPTIILLAVAKMQMTHETLLLQAMSASCTNICCCSVYVLTTLYVSVNLTVLLHRSQQISGIMTPTILFDSK